VLPIALENATRIIQIFLKERKEYVALMHLHSEVSNEEIKKVFEEFTGTIKQLPPIKSAVKRQERFRRIYSIEILEIEDKDVLFEVGCEAGTYIRKLCLSPETEVFTANGIKTIKNICSAKENCQVFSYNSDKLSKNKITDFQEIPYKGDLLEIVTASGIKLRITPDHQLLVSKLSGNKMKEATKMRPGEYLVRNISIPTISKEIFAADLIDDEFLIHDKDIKNQCTEALIKKFGSIREFSRRTNMDRKPFLKNSKIGIKIKHLKAAKIFNDLRSRLSCFKSERGKIIKVKSNLDIELLYLLGLIASDGNNTKEKNTIRNTRIKFHNSEECLINEFYEKTNICFPGIKVTKKRINERLWQIETSNSLFATMCKNLGIVSPSKNSDVLAILELRKELISAFLKGYFDGDGNAYFKTKGKTAYSNIRFFSVDFMNTKRIHQMLLKLGMQNKIFKKKLSTKGFKSKNKFIFIVELSDPPSKFKFCKLIGSNHPRKIAYLKQIENYFRNIEESSDDYLNAFLDKTKHLRKTKNISTILGGNGSRIVNKKIPISRYIAKKLNSFNGKVSNNLGDFTLDKIISIRKIKYEGFVYDITVDRDHNFLIENGIVSSNCHDIGLKLKTGAHMASLVRTKTGPFTDKNWHSLHDLKDSHEEFKEGNDSPLRDIIVPVEFAIQHSKKVWVHDSAVDHLCHGSPLYIPGISKLSDNIIKDDKVAVLTLKNELISLGISSIDSNSIIKSQKDIAVKLEKVFMPVGIYK